MELQNTLTEATHLFEQGEQLHRAGKYQEAIGCFEKTASVFLDLKKGEEYALTLNEWSRSLLRIGEYELATDKATQALSVCRQQLEENPSLVAESFNTLGNIQNRMGKLDNALQYYHKSLTLRLQVFGENHPKTASSYNNLGSIYNTKGNYDKALYFDNKSLNIKLKTLSENHPSTAISYGNIGSQYREKGDYKKAIFYHLKALQIKQEVLGNLHSSTAISFNDLGAIYWRQGNYEKALEYFIQSLHINLQTLGETHLRTTGNYTNLGIISRETTDYEKAIFYHTKSLNNRLQILGKNHPLTALSYNNLGRVCIEQGNYEKAIDYNTKSLEIYLKSVGEMHPEVALVFHNLGRAYSEKDYMEKAINHHSKSLAIRLKIYGQKHPYTAESHIYLGDTLQVYKKFEEALKHYQLALQLLFPMFTSDNVYTNPKHNLSSFGGNAQCTSFLIGLNTLYSKAKTFYACYKNTQSSKDLVAAFETYLVMKDQIILLHKSFQEAEMTKLTFAQRTKQMYENALQTALEVAPQLPEKKQEALEFAFSCIEQAKATLLLSHFKNTEAKAATNIPQPLLGKEYHLKVELNYLDKRILQLSSKLEDNDTNPELQELQSQRFDYFQEYEKLIQQLEEDYPQYYQLKYDSQTVTIVEIQRQLQTNQALINFFMGGSYIYVFVVTQTDCLVHSIEEVSNIKNKISDFNYYLEEVSERKHYLQIAHQLYQDLLEPVLKQPPINELVIIPDGILSTLSFEALLTAAVPPMSKYADLPYLLMNYEVSYHFSATLWKKNQDKKPNKGTSLEGSFIGFAPVYQHLNETKENAQFMEQYYQGENAVNEVVRGKDCLVLQHSEKEVEGIADLFLKKGHEQVKVVLHEQASERNFRKVVGDFDYIHIAAHGVLNEKYPELSGVLFSPNEAESEDSKNVENTASSNGLLCIADVYGLQLKAKLVVLSCCETGIGKLSKGEGAIALNRGFLYAGVERVVYTLFKIPDAASAQLMQFFYAVMLEGKGYAKALREAKLRLIQLGEARPLKWAGFLLIG